MTRKLTAGYFLLAFYETIRAIFFLQIQPESAISLLPASWYAAVPLLAVPVMLSLMAQPHSNERFYYLITKAAQVAGVITYAVKDYPYALYGHLNSWYSLAVIGQIVLFSVIDAILFVILIIPKKGKVEDADNSNSQR